MLQLKQNRGSKNCWYSVALIGGGGGGGGARIKEKRETMNDEALRNKR